MSDQETPRPPATPEFGAVTPGGPTHHYEPAGAMRVRKLSVGPYDNNVYVIECAETREALLVDGANDASRLLAELDGLRVVGIAQTHSHFDHVQALEQLVDALGVPVYAHPDDAGGIPVPTHPLGDGDSLAVGTVEVAVMHTPGHTPGSLCYLAGSHLFSGDTLFPAGPGNTFQSAEAFATIMRSLDEKLFVLPDDVRVSPGHGLDTTIGRERPHVETWRARGW